MVKSAYIHIPFCKSICSYCDFCKVFYNKKWVDSYLNALENEIQKEYKGEILKTIYIGGGTPSSLDIDELNKLFAILNKLNLNNYYEYTIECNIEDITEETATSQEKEGILSDIGDNQFVKKVKISIAENDKGEKIYTYKYLILDKDMVSGENGSSSDKNGSGENGSENGGNSSSGENGSGGNGSNDNKTDNGTGGNGSDDKSSENGNGGNSSETGDNGKEGGVGGSSTEDKKTTESPDKKADEDSRDTEEGTAKVGSVVTSGGAKYKVTASNSVSYKASTKASATGVVVPASVKINGKVYKVTTVEANAFKGNTKLTKVVIGKNVQTVGKNAFAGCTNLTTVTLGSNVTTIGDGAFSGCKKLTKVVIPGKVKKIGKKAFYKCTNLKKIIIKTKKLGKKSIGANAFKGINKKAAVSVPKAKKKAYTKYLRKAGLPKNSKIK